MREFFYTGSIHFRQFPATLVFVAESPLPSGWGKLFLHWIYAFQAIPSNFGLCGRKAPSLRDEGNFYTQDLSISGNFEQLWFLCRKAPPPRMREIFLHWIYPFQAILSNVGFCGRKAPPPQDEGNLFTLDLSISGNFQQLWILWQKTSSPLPQDEGKYFTLDLSISGNFQQLWFWWQKSPLPPGWGKTILHRIYPFQAIWATLVFVAESPTPQDEGHFFTLDLSISGNSQQLWFLWQKSPSPQDEGNFLQCIYPFQAISSNIGFVAEKPPPQDEGIFFHWIYQFQAIPSNFGFVAEKPPPCQDEGNFFTLDLSIWGNFQQLWFLWQKSPLPMD